MAKDVGKGTILQIDLAGGTSYTAIAQIKMIQLPESSMGDVDVTCLDSTIVEYIPDELIEHGTLNFDIEWDPDLAGHQQIYTNLGTLGVKFQVVPPGNSGTNTCTFTGYFNKFAPSAIEPKNSLRASANVRPTSALTFVT